MNCCICRKNDGETALSILDLHLCAACYQKLLRADPAQPGYEWYVAHVRRGLVEPMLHTGNVVPIERYRALRRAAK